MFLKQFTLKTDGINPDAAASSSKTIILLKVNHQNCIIKKTIIEETINIDRTIIKKSLFSPICFLLKFSICSPRYNKYIFIDSVTICFNIIILYKRFLFTIFYHSFALINFYSSIPILC